MKHKYSIGFLIVIIFILLFILFPISTEKSEQSTNDQPESIETDGYVIKENSFYLFEINGYVVVFLNDQKTPYEYTDILYDELPLLLQQEIRNGKYIKNLEELYGFLENYSS